MTAGPTSSDVATVINGVEVRRNVENRTTLAGFLRDQVGLTGTKVSCDIQVCPASLRVAGTSVLRRDLMEKVTGAAQYTVDITPVGACHAKVVRADRAHAKVVGVDRSAAAAVPGVVGIVTSEDLGGLFPRFGHIIADHPILAIDVVRYYGEPVAIVVAETLAAASDAAELVVVSYDDLAAVMTPEEALAPGAPHLHEHPYPGSRDDSFAVLAATPKQGGTTAPPRNVAHEVTLEWGDVDSCWATAELEVTTTAHYPMLYAYAMEPYNAVATYSDGQLTVVSSAQHPFMVRNDLARIFDLPLSRVRVSAPYLGGGYGSKSYTKVEPMAAVASWAVGRTVKLVCDVEDAIYTTRADSATATVRSAFTTDGTILARDIDLVLNSGAYADNSPLVLAKAVDRCFGPYRVPNLRVRGRSVYTNTSPASSYRGFGTPQGVIASEMNLDQAAQQLKLDPAQLRRRNLVTPGQEILPGKRGIDADLIADLDLIDTALNNQATSETRYATGLACSASDAGAFPVSTASVRIQTDGSVTLSSGSTEMGQGSQSALAQIAAQELEVPLHCVAVTQGDTAVTAYERTTGASRTTTLVGLAVQRACADARQKIAVLAADTFEVSVAGVQAHGAGVSLPGRHFVSYGEVITRWFGAEAGEVTGIGLVRRSDVTAQMPPFWEIGMVGVGLTVDEETGVVTVRHLATVADVGFAINPHAVEGQDLGAATQGLGAALHEELIYDGPQIANPNMVEYRVPRATDMPARIDTFLVERRDGVGPYGAKGAGEGALNPIGPAVATAVARATGRWPDRLPLTPERVWRMLNDLPSDDG